MAETEAEAERVSGEKVTCCSGEMFMAVVSAAAVASPTAGTPAPSEPRAKAKTAREAVSLPLAVRLGVE